MPCGTVYAYGTTIRVWYRKTYYTRIVRTVRVRYVPYAYGMKYAYGTQHSYIVGLLNLTFDVACTEAWTTRGVKCLLNGNDARIVTKYSCFQGTQWPVL